MIVATCGLCRQLVAGLEPPATVVEPQAREFGEFASFAQAFGAHLAQFHQHEFEEVAAAAAEVVGWFALCYAVSTDPRFVEWRERGRQGMLERLGFKQQTISTPPN